MVIEKTYNTDLSKKMNLIKFYQSEPKLLIRRIVNRQNRLSVAYTNKRLVFKKDINPFIPINKSYNPKYLLSILASKLISFLYINISSIATKDDFRQTTLAELRELPIANASLSDMNFLIAKVDAILNLRKINSEADTKIFENEIDQKIYELYDLTEEEIKIVEEAVL